MKSASVAIFIGLSGVYFYIKMSMFDLLNKGKLVKEIERDKFAYTKPKYRMIYDLNCGLENTPLGVKEMYCEEDLILILTESGVICVVKYSCGGRVKSMIRISCYAQTNKQAKSIAVNKVTKELMIVYLSRSGGMNELKSVAIALEKLRKYMRVPYEHTDTSLSRENQNTLSPLVTYFSFTLNSSSPKESDFTSLFLSENLSSPAFIEFDETNKVVITRNSLSAFKVWSMADYKLIFSLSDRRIEELRTSDGILVTIRSTTALDKLLLSVYDISTGKNVINYESELTPNQELEVLEIFDHTLLLKQTGSYPTLSDMISLECRIIPNCNLDDKSLFMYVNYAKMIIALNKNVVYFYSTTGEELRRIRNESVDNLWPSSVCLSEEKKYFVVYWEEKRKEKIEEVGVGIGIGMGVGGNVGLRTPIGIGSKSILGSSIGKKRMELSPGLSAIEKVTEEENFSDYFFQSDDKENWNVTYCSQMNINKDDRDINKSHSLPFKGEFEIISLKEGVKQNKLNLVSIDESHHETISHFSFIPEKMSMYLITTTGKLYECTL